MPSGELLSSGTFKNGKPEGNSFFYQKDGLLTEIIQFSQGQPNGLYIKFYPSLQIEIAGSMENNKRRGLWTHYYNNGKLKSRGRYFSKNPIQIEIDEVDDSIMEEFGLSIFPIFLFPKDGEWKYWNKNGNISCTEIYDKGMLLKSDGIIPEETRISIRLQELNTPK